MTGFVLTHTYSNTYTHTRTDTYRVTCEARKSHLHSHSSLFAVDACQAASSPDSAPLYHSSSSSLSLYLSSLLLHLLFGINCAGISMINDIELSLKGAGVANVGHRCLQCLFIFRNIRFVVRLAHTHTLTHRQHLLCPMVSALRGQYDK